VATLEQQLKEHKVTEEKVEEFRRKVGADSKDSWQAAIASESETPR
jgi:hypothetical protein